MNRMNQSFFSPAQKKRKLKKDRYELEKKPRGRRPNIGRLEKEAGVNQDWRGSIAWAKG